MPLTAPQRKQVSNELMEIFSSQNTEVPTSKSFFRTIVDSADDAIETAEGALPASFAAADERRLWLEGNPKRMRRILELVQKKRRRVL